MTMELNSVHCCDALELLRSLPSEAIDMILTSPPYDNLRTYNGYSWDFEGIAQESYRVLKQGGVLVWVVGDATIDGSETLTSMRQALYFKDVVGFCVHDTMVWEKHTIPHGAKNKYREDFEYMFVLTKGEPNTFNPIMRKNYTAGQVRRKTTSSDNGSIHRGGKRVSPDESILTNVWLVTVGNSGTTKDEMAFEHPAIFPEALAERHIMTWTNPGDIVLDYFLGSGTTAKMARNLNRRYLGCDISPEYVDIAKRRLALPFTTPMFE